MIGKYITKDPFFRDGMNLFNIETERWSKEQIQKLTYVGITRTRYQLFVPFIDECELIRNLFKAKKD